MKHTETDAETGPLTLRRGQGVDHGARTGSRAAGALATSWALDHITHSQLTPHRARGSMSCPSVGEPEAHSPESESLPPAVQRSSGEQCEMGPCRHDNPGELRSVSGV